MRRSRAVTLMATCGLLGTLLVVPAGAEPSSDEVRRDLQDAQARLQDLQMETAGAVEDYNEAQLALEELEGELATTQDERDHLGDEVASLTDAAAEHARRMHKLGPTVELSSVWVAGDSSELGARTAALGRILDGQRADIEGLGAARTSLSSTEERLHEQHGQAQAHTDEVEAARERVEAVLADQQDEIDALEVELGDAEEREARESAEAEAEQRRQEEAEEEAEEQAAREAGAQAQQEAQTEEAASDRNGDDQTRTGDGNDTSSNDTSSNETSDNETSDNETSSDDEPAPSTRQSAQVAVDAALDQVGKPYQFGAGGPDAFDCSGLTSYAWRAAGVDITRSSRSQWQATTEVSRGELQPGDLVFYSSDGTAAGIGHVAMYIGGGQIVEASRPGVPVRTTSDGLQRNDIIGYGRP